MCVSAIDVEYNDTVDPIIKPISKDTNFLIISILLQMLTQFALSPLLLARVEFSYLIDYTLENKVLLRVLLPCSNYSITTIG